MYECLPCFFNIKSCSVTASVVMISYISFFISFIIFYYCCYQTTSHFLITVGFLFVKEEDDSLFDKGEVNFWAEKLTHVRQLSKHLLHLISVTHLTLPEHGELNHLSRIALDQAQCTEHLLGALPLVPEFSRTPEFTRLTIQKERISVCLKILNLLKSDDTCKKWKSINY